MVVVTQTIPPIIFMSSEYMACVVRAYTKKKMMGKQAEDLFVQVRRRDTSILNVAAPNSANASF